MRWCVAWMAVLAFCAAGARWQLDLETGVVESGYNDVRIPGNGGDLFSLSEDLSLDAAPYLRAHLAYRAGRHRVGLLVAPLRLEAEGSFDRNVRFQDRTFPAGEPVEATFRFDSYRLTYRYTVHSGKNLSAAVGLTAKVRDAEISVRDSQGQATKTNTGFVPLVHVAAEWWVGGGLSLVAVADALAAPQGRAEDVLLGLQAQVLPPVTLRVGYRILEGGADTDEVYNFALLHYLGLGVVVTW